MLLPYYEVREGKGPYVLLVHGFLSSRAQWLPNLDALSTVGTQKMPRKKITSAWEWA